MLEIIIHFNIPSENDVCFYDVVPVPMRTCDCGVYTIGDLKVQSARSFKDFCNFLQDTRGNDVRPLFDQQAAVYQRFSGFPCQLCPRTFTQAGALKRHMESVHLKLTFTCDECSNVYTRRDTLTQHKKLKHDHSIMFL